MVDFNRSREETLGRITAEVEYLAAEGNVDDVLNYLYFLRDDTTKIIKGICRKQRKANKAAK